MWPSPHKRSGSVETYAELPYLKFLGGDGLVVELNDRDFVQKPIRSAVLGTVSTVFEDGRFDSRLYTANSGMDS
jgi:hypothetical protein